jgi:hypothetical protein
VGLREGSNLCSKPWCSLTALEPPIISHVIEGRHVGRMDIIHARADVAWVFAERAPRRTGGRIEFGYTERQIEHMPSARFSGLCCQPMSHKW